jgi:hypothetical protein
METKPLAERVCNVIDTGNGFYFMSNTPESKVKRRVKELLTAHEIYQFWPVQSGFGARTLDCLACHRGQFFAIETKAPGKKMTEQQCAIGQRIERSQGRVFCISSEDRDSLEWVELRSWISSVSDGMMPTGFAELSVMRDGEDNSIPDGPQPPARSGVSSDD